MSLPPVPAVARPSTPTLLIPVHPSPSPASCAGGVESTGAGRSRLTTTSSPTRLLGSERLGPDPTPVVDGAHLSLNGCRFRRNRRVNRRRPDRLRDLLPSPSDPAAQRGRCTSARPPGTPPRPRRTWVGPNPAPRRPNAAGNDVGPQGRHRPSPPRPCDWPPPRHFPPAYQSLYSINPQNPYCLVPPGSGILWRIDTAIGGVSDGEGHDRAAVETAVQQCGSVLCDRDAVTRSAGWTGKAPGPLWVEPAVRGTPGVGCGHKYTAWQLAGFAVVAGCLRSSRFAGHNIGHHGVARAMEGLAERDDALLMPPEPQDPYVQEAPPHGSRVRQSARRTCRRRHERTSSEPSVPSTKRRRVCMVQPGACRSG